MPGTLRVTIDVERLRSHLAREDDRDVTEAEVLQWLHVAGFRPDSEGWIVSESDLGQLDPSEVVGVEVIE